MIATVTSHGVATLARRERISPDVLAVSRRIRIVRGFAECVAKSGYRNVTVTDIVRAAGIARNTFYETFPSKRGVAPALLASVVPTLGEDASPLEIECESVLVLAVELAASRRVGEHGRADAEVTTARGLLAALDAFEPPTGQGNAEADPRLSTLPPGRHGLPREFVEDNQRHRLLTGLAVAIAEHGYETTTIAHVTQLAAVSRRTFYEHFDSKADAAVGLLVSAGFADIDPETGLGSVVAEVIASALIGNFDAADVRREAAVEIVETLAACKSTA